MARPITLPYFNRLLCLLNSLHLSQVLCCGLFKQLADLFEQALLEVGVFVEGGGERPDDAGQAGGVEQRCPESLLADLVTVGSRNSLDQTFEPEAPKLIAHPSRGELIWRAGE